MIEDKPWQDVIDLYDDADTLFYADPPYLPSTWCGRLYKHEMSQEDHVELLAALGGVKGLVMLSGYESDVYQERLAYWRRIRFTMRCTVAAQKKNTARTEVVWLNYDKDGTRLTGPRNLVTA